MTARRALLVLLVGLCSIVGCRRGLSAARDEEPQATREETAEAEGPIEIKTVTVPGDEPVFVLFGPRGACPRMVFLHGMCGHGLGYIQSFQQAARDHGGVIALQGDISCGGPYRKYTADAAVADARIERAFAAIEGEGEGSGGACAAGNDLVIGGYSQGAYIAERLAARFPERYTRLVLIGAPTTPSAALLGKARGVVAISGELDAAYRMRDGVKALAAAGVPSTYLEMPGARHGEMREGERIMGEALGWLEVNAR